MITQNTPARLLPPGWRNNPQFVYCGRPSIFGSPFPLQRGEKPGSTLGKFREYFLNRVNNNPGFRAAVLALRGKTLVCPGPTCTVDRCHTQIISDWINAQFEAENNHLLELKRSDPDLYYDLRMSDE